ncbi:MAG: helix-turn-helix domain-containing protein [Gemmatimonadetes bacterium]|jgi:transcriptional regulator with XRE-family HTH domain|nr:helix-turn-helix domain-containing protein [Gemmatimonadota bacterium]
MIRKLGEELKRARQGLGLSLQAVAIPAEVSAAYLHKLEQGKVETPSPRSLRRIGNELGVAYLRLLRLAEYLEDDDLGSDEEATETDSPLAGYDLTDAEAQAVRAFVRLLVEQRGATP